jgi:hypothetical protein
MCYYITPAEEDLEHALTAWSWLDLAHKMPSLVTAFGDVFFQAENGIWLLDTLRGRFERICASRQELDAMLANDEVRTHYLLALLVDEAEQHGEKLGPGQCYDFEMPLVLGGNADYANVERMDFVVAVHLRGQIHDQVRNLPAGTPIGKLVLVPPKRARPWWKFWLP